MTALLEYLDLLLQDNSQKVEGRRWHGPLVPSSPSWLHCVPIYEMGIVCVDTTCLCKQL